MATQHPSGYQLSQFARKAGEAIAEGLICTEASSQTLIADGGANQAATQQLMIVGITTAACKLGAVPDVAEAGSPVPVIAGTGGLAKGEEFVAENGTGRALGITTGSVTLAAGDTIGGRVLVAAAAGDPALVEVNIRRFYENS